jgi:hypothetical protein
VGINHIAKGSANSAGVDNMALVLLMFQPYFGAIIFGVLSARSARIRMKDLCLVAAVGTYHKVSRECLPL